MGEPTALTMTDDKAARKITVLAAVTTVVGLWMWPVMVIALPASLVGTFMTWRSAAVYRRICLACAFVCVAGTTAAYIYWRSTT